MSKPNLSELVQAAQEKVEDPRLRARINRNVERGVLLRLVKGELSPETLPEPGSAEYRDKIPRFVNAMWERVRYSVSGCPLEDRGLDACFTCPDVQSAACALSNQELLELKLPEVEEKEEVQQMSDNTIKTLEEWDEYVESDPAAANEAMRHALQERHEMSPTGLFKKKQAKKKAGEKVTTQQILVELDEAAGNFAEAEAPKKKAGVKTGTKAGVKTKTAEKAVSAPAAEGVDLSEALERLDALEAKIDKVYRLVAGMAVGLDAVEYLANVSEDVLEEEVAEAFPPNG